MGAARLVDVAVVCGVLVLNGLAGLAGAVLPERLLRERRATLIGFAAGALVTASLVDVIPESSEVLGAGSASWWVLGGFIAFAVLEWLLGPHHHADHADDAPPIVRPSTLLLSDGFHNVGDGAAIAAAFLASPGLGAAVSLAVIAHEVPQELGDFVILRAAGVSRRRALALLALVQATAFAGAAAVWLVAGHVDALVARVLGVAAGSFLYIGATDLLPELRARAGSRSDRRSRVAGFLAGCALIAVAQLV